MKNGVKKPVKPLPKKQAPRPKPPVPEELRFVEPEPKPVKPQTFKEVQKKTAVKKIKKEVQHSDIYIFGMCMLTALAILLAAGFVSNVIGYFINGG